MRYWFQKSSRIAMTQQGEAIARYHKLLQAEPYRDLGWAGELREKMLAANLREGSGPLCPFLRPNFLTRRQHATLTKAAESLCASINRVLSMALSNPALLARIGLLPAEKMLAAVDPGYQTASVTSLLDGFMGGNSFRIISHSTDAAPSLAASSVLSRVFYDCPPVRQFRRQYNLARIETTKPLASALQGVYKQFKGTRKPRIGVLEFRQAFQAAEGSHYILVRDMLREHGLEAEIVTPEALEYRAGILRQGPFVMDMVLRRFSVQEFLLRYDLTHPLVRAYRDRSICVVNSFRSELARKRSILALLTDETVTAGFPAAERRVIAEHVPWTRLVVPGETKRAGKNVDLSEFVIAHREQLVLKPNDPGAEEHAIQGWNCDATRWERALRQAARTPMVVQERVEQARETFPVLRYGALEMKELQVDLRPLASLGKVHGFSAWLSDVSDGGFSSVAGPVPTYILEPRG
jgi:hypothetical protein